MGNNNDISAVYKIDLSKQNYTVEFVCDLPFYYRDSYNYHINSSNFMSDVRNIDHLFIVKDDILYYCDENNVFYQYDLKMNKKSTLIDKRYDYYGPFNTGYYNKKNNYIFGNDDLYSNYYDILYIPSGLAKRENLNSNNNFKYNIQYYIPFENYVFGIYSKSFSQEYGILKIDIENNDLTELITYDKNLSFEFSYENKIYLSDSNENILYEYDTINNTLNEISNISENADFSEYNSLIKYKLNANYMIDVIRYEQSNIMTFAPLENASTSNNYSYEILYNIDLKNDNKIINSKDKTNTYENVLYVK